MARLALRLSLFLAGSLFIPACTDKGGTSGTVPAPPAPSAQFPSTDRTRSAYSPIQMGATDAAVQNFWKYFRDRRDSLIVGEAVDEEAYDDLLKKLQKVQPGLFIQLGVSSRPYEMIVTAEGRRELFNIAEAIVAQAPPVDGWVFRALVPKLGLPKTTRWNDVLVPMADVTFRPLALEDGKLGLRLFIPKLRRQDTVEAHSALLRALDHALGERGLAIAIEGTEVASTPEGPEARELRPLAELEDFLRRRWKTLSLTYENFPLMLRTRTFLDFDSLQRSFPTLVIVTHALAEVQSSGLPTPAYNVTLADLDHDVLTAFEKSEGGLTVLVETFGGKRTYYSYVSTKVDPKALESAIRSKHPGHHLTWESRKDSEWSFIRRYSRDYGF